MSILPIIFYFIIRITEDGQYEAIPGTIEVQDNNEDVLVQNTDEVQEKDLEKEEAQIEHEARENFTSGNNILLKQEIINGESPQLSDNEEGYGTPEYLLSDNENDEENNINQGQNEEDFGTAVKNNYFEVTPDIQEDSNLINFNEDSSEPTETKSKFFKSRESKITQLFKNNKQNTPVTVLDKKLSYILLDAIEKENLQIAEISNIPSKNSRSILKTSYLIPIEDPNKKNSKNTIRMLNNNKDVTKIVKNGANENKIADKSVRQPRKQTIKPIERSGSEIIVQPMFYSFNEEPSSEIIHKKRKYTRRNSQEIVKVSDDSDPDYTGKYFFLIIIILK